MGLGLYNNETQRHIKDDCMEKGHWYVNDAGYLYIVPNDLYGIAEIEGPDGDVLDALNKCYREASFDTIDPEQVAEALGLEVVAEVLKRFDSEAGYYHA